MKKKTVYKYVSAPFSFPNTDYILRQNVKKNFIKSKTFAEKLTSEKL